MAKVQLQDTFSYTREVGAVEKYYGVQFVVREDFSLVAEVNDELAKEMIENGRCCKVKKVAE